mmetsp:Transcript_20225/g.50310  ORF Transcript_20225/g.50310 Transcript_20225/m.50310 type:complete len:228 (-) Transcript_20225:101-784(-)
MRMKDAEDALDTHRALQGIVWWTEGRWHSKAHHAKTPPVGRLGMGSHGAKDTRVVGQQSATAVTRKDYSVVFCVEIKRAVAFFFFRANAKNFLVNVAGGILPSLDVAFFVGIPFCGRRSCRRVGRILGRKGLLHQLQSLEGVGHDIHHVLEGGRCSTYGHKEGFRGFMLMDCKAVGSDLDDAFSFFLFVDLIRYFYQIGQRHSFRIRGKVWLLLFRCLENAATVRLF